MLPAGIWLLLANLLTRFVAFRVHIQAPGRRVNIVLLRWSLRLSRAGYHSWRFWGAKWR